MKKLIGLFTLLLLLTPALAEINPEYRQPQPPMYLDLVPPMVPPVRIGQPLLVDEASEERLILPVLPSLPELPLPVPIVPPRVDLPGSPGMLDGSGRLEEPVAGINGNREDQPRIPVVPPIFRSSLVVSFSQGYAGQPINVRLYDLHGRLRLSQEFSAGSQLRLEGPLLSSLPAGGYVVVVDCGPGHRHAARSVKVQ